MTIGHVVIVKMLMLHQPYFSTLASQIFVAKNYILVTIIRWSLKVVLLVTKLKTVATFRKYCIVTTKDQSEFDHCKF